MEGIQIKRTLSSIAALGLLAGAASSQVIISEIMYNPDSSEGAPNNVEWVELYNTSAGAVVLDGWALADEDGSATIPAGTTIAAGEAIVLFSDGITSLDFKFAWPGVYQAIPVDFGALSGLANSPTATNEILMISDTTPTVIDTVNYEDTGAWPSDSPDGASIALLECFLDATANDDGSNWRNSKVGMRGGVANIVTAVFGGADIGSPGTVPVTMAAAVFRNGSGTNPATFVSVSPPIVGTSWMSTIDIVTPGAVASFIGVAAAPLMVPLSVGELLIDITPGLLALDIAAGAHSIPLAADCTLAGLTLYAQGGTFKPGGTKLVNAIDLTFGSF